MNLLNEIILEYKKNTYTSIRLLYTSMLIALCTYIIWMNNFMIIIDLVRICNYYFYTVPSAK